MTDRSDLVDNDPRDVVRSFVCAMCRQQFRTAVPEQDVNREYLRNFPGGAGDSGLSSVCDDCYRYVMAWLRGGNR